MLHKSNTFFSSLLSSGCILFPSNLHTIISSQNLSCFLPPTFVFLPQDFEGLLSYSVLQQPLPWLPSAALSVSEYSWNTSVPFPAPLPDSSDLSHSFNLGRAPCFLPDAPLVFHSTLSALCFRSTWHLHISCSSNKDCPTDMRKWLAFLSYYRVSSPAVILKGSAQQAFTELRSERSFKAAYMAWQAGMLWLLQLRPSHSVT